jgi:cardiolipin synthase
MLRLRHHRKLIFGVFVLVVVVAGLLALAQDQVTLTIRSNIAAEDSRFPAYVSALVGADLRRGNRYTVLTNGDQMFPAMLAAIDTAKRRISLETYIYDKGQLGDRFTGALEAAARRGVHVDIVADAVGASTIPEDHVKRLRAAGCHLAMFNTPSWYSLEDVNYRTHRKILVVDGEVGFTGGAGVADHWLGHAQDKDHWRDTQIEMHGPIVRLMEGAFYENFLEADGTEAPALDAPMPDPGDQAPSFLVRSSPTGGSNDLKRLYLFAIASARRSIDVTTPYFVTDESSMWSIEDSVRRGVKVRILVEGDITDAKPVKYASRQAYEHLLELGVSLYEYQPTMMHTKTMVVDGVWSMFGSANFDNRSLELNDEMNVAVTDSALAARLLQDFENDVKSARQLDLGSWRNRPILEKSREYFWSYFGEIF